MEKDCICQNNYYYPAEEAKRFYSGQEWNESLTDFGKIIECPACHTLWDFTYVDDKKNFVLKKKFKQPEILLDKFVNISLDKPAPTEKFLENKVAKVFPDDKSLIIELSWDWSFEGRKIRYLFIKSRYAGYLSDLFTNQLKSIPVIIGYPHIANFILDLADEEAFALKWPGLLEKK